MHLVFLTCFFLYFYQCTALFHPVFEQLHIHRDRFVIPILSIAALSSILLFLQTRNKRRAIRELLHTVVAWVPWLIYLGFRWDPEDLYSSRKLFLMVITQFGSVLMICLAFYNDQERFTRYFYLCTVGMVTLFLVYFFVNHGRYDMYISGYEMRLTTENVNPIWLGRSFGIGALCLMVWGRFAYCMKIGLCVPFFVGIYLTGSRGPAISVFIMFGLHYLWTQSRYKNSAERIFLSCLFLIPCLFAAGLSFSDSFQEYFTRGKNQDINQASSGRYDALIVSWKELVSAPAFCVGLGKFGNPGKANISYKDKKDIKSDSMIIKAQADYPNNIVLEVLAELGLIGFILFVLLLRPGRWMFGLSNKFVFAFLLCLLFAMTSGDFYGNACMFIFCQVAWLNR